LSKSKKILWS